MLTVSWRVAVCVLVVMALRDGVSVSAQTGEAVTQERACVSVGEKAESARRRREPRSRGPRCPRCDARRRGSSRSHSRVSARLTLSVSSEQAECGWWPSRPRSAAWAALSRFTENDADICHSSDGRPWAPARGRLAPGKPSGVRGSGTACTRKGHGHGHTRPRTGACKGSQGHCYSTHRASQPSGRPLQIQKGRTRLSRLLLLNHTPGGPAGSCPAPSSTGRPSFPFRGVALRSVVRANPCAERGVQCKGSKEFCCPSVRSPGPPQSDQCPRAQGLERRLQTRAWSCSGRAAHGAAHSQAPACLRFRPVLPPLAASQRLSRGQAQHRARGAAGRSEVRGRPSAPAGDKGPIPSATAVGAGRSRTRGKPRLLLPLLASCLGRRQHRFHVHQTLMTCP